jgi:hypothetical protein
METINEPGSPEPGQLPATPLPAPAPELPRAAATVNEGKSQAEIDLAAKLTEAQKTIKGNEMTLAQLMDENRQLRRVTSQPARHKRSTMEAFLSGED